MSTNTETEAAIVAAVLTPHPTVTHTFAPEPDGVPSGVTLDAIGEHPATVIFPGAAK